MSVPDVENAFSEATKPELFKQKYHVPKPTKDSYLIFSCAIGKRSQKAVDTVEKLGYTKWATLNLKDLFMRSC